LLQAVESRCVDLLVQSWRDSPIQREEPQQSTQRCDLVLEGSTAETFTCLADENLDVLRLNAEQRDSPPIKVFEEGAGDAPVIGHAVDRETANLS
jgi:hypothetical protein